MWDKDREEALLHECRAAVESAAEAYLAIPPLPVSAVFDHIYAEPPADLIEQRNAALELAQGAA
jgi:pyruvate dehydrogenase E1 component alpha subunit